MNEVMWLSPSWTPAQVSSWKTRSGYSILSSPPGLKAWARDCRSASRSSKPTEVYAITDFARGTGTFSADYPGGVNGAGVPTNTIGRTNQVGVAIGLRTMF